MKWVVVASDLHVSPLHNTIICARRLVAFDTFAQLVSTYLVDVDNEILLVGKLLRSQIALINQTLAEVDKSLVNSITYPFGHLLCSKGIN